jgi:predicted nucleotidyltransferase
MTIQQEKIVRDILRQYIPHYEVWAFGSRVTGGARPYSDLDLMMITDQPLSLAVHAALVEAFSTSDLPWRVDVIDWSSVSEDFRDIVKQAHVVVQSPLL